MQFQKYLQLLRIANVFTVPGDIMAGYFIILSISLVGNINSNNFNIISIELIIMIFSSSFLYLAGIISNDLFDMKIDKLHDRKRPLSSGLVSRKVAILLCIVLFFSGLYLAILINLTSFLVAVLLTIGILGYNYKIKNGYFRPFLMGGLRSLNIIYGSTIVLNLFQSWDVNSIEFISIGNTFQVSFQSLLLLTLCSSAVFVHIFILTKISSIETKIEYQKIKGARNISFKYIFFIYLILLVCVGSIAYYYSPQSNYFLLFFILFLSASIGSYFIVLKKNMGADYIQKFVKNQIILLILLDSSFIAGTAGLYYGIISSALLIPCIILSRKIKMT